MTADMVELKPCPFCGGTAILDAVFPLDGGKFWLVHCRNCRAQGPFGPTYTEKEMAVTGWNKRAPTLFGLPIVEVDDLDDASQIMLGPPLI